MTQCRICRSPSGIRSTPDRASARTRSISRRSPRQRRKGKGGSASSLRMKRCGMFCGIRTAWPFARRARSNGRGIASRNAGCAMARSELSSRPMRASRSSTSGEGRRKQEGREGKGEDTARAQRRAMNVFANVISAVAFASLRRLRLAPRAQARTAVSGNLRPVQRWVDVLGPSSDHPLDLGINSLDAALSDQPEFNHRPQFVERLNAMRRCCACPTIFANLSSSVSMETSKRGVRGQSRDADATVVSAHPPLGELRACFKSPFEKEAHHAHQL